MCLMALDNINLKKISQELFDKYNLAAFDNVDNYNDRGSLSCTNKNFATGIKELVRVVLIWTVPSTGAQGGP